MFEPRSAPQHPELAIWLTATETYSHDYLQAVHTRSKGGRVGGRRGEEGGVAPAFRSRDPHLARAEQTSERTGARRGFASTIFLVVVSMVQVHSSHPEHR